jgi:hypothetical protein
MASRTAWTAGNSGSGYAWQLLFNSADLASLGTASAVMSSITPIANQTNQDIFFDVSLVLAIASTTLTSGASFALYLYPLLQDATSYGDDAFSAGTGSTHTITNTKIGQAPIYSFAFPITAAATTTMKGSATGLIMPPGTWLPALANWTAPATALGSGTQSVYYRTYNMNLNN